MAWKSATIAWDSSEWKIDGTTTVQESVTVSNVTTSRTRIAVRKRVTALTYAAAVATGEAYRAHDSNASVAIEQGDAGNCSVVIETLDNTAWNTES